jgi:predicted metal-binding protein
MTKHTLFVCKSCSASIAHDDVTEETITEGVLLLNQLQQLNQNQSEHNKLNVQAVGCLWTCDRPCSVTFACPEKYTYHFVDLPAEAIADALLQFSQIYRQSEDGYVLPAKIPQSLRSRLLVRVPPVS